MCNVLEEIKNITQQRPHHLETVALGALTTLHLNTHKHVNGKRKAKGIYSRQIRKATEMDWEVRKAVGIACVKTPTRVRLGDVPELVINPLFGIACLLKSRSQPVASVRPEETSKWGRPSSDSTSLPQDIANFLLSKAMLYSS